jgi:hypothetical protein
MTTTLTVLGGTLTRDLAGTWRWRDGAPADSRSVVAIQ